jgi:hypothetical protein
MGPHALNREADQSESRVDQVGIGERNTEKAARKSTSEPLLALSDGFQVPSITFLEVPQLVRATAYQRKRSHHISAQSRPSRTSCYTAVTG